MSEVKLVVLSKYSTLHEANIVLSFLKANQIDATLFDEHTVNIYATPAIFSGIRLMVPSTQLERAQVLVHDQKDFASNSNVLVLGDNCPKCKSKTTEITHIHRKDLLWLILSFLIVFPMHKESRRDWKCHSCQHTWSQKSSSFNNTSMVIFIRLLILIFIGLGLFFYFKKL